MIPIERYLRMSWLEHFFLLHNFVIINSRMHILNHLLDIIRLNWTQFLTFSCHKWFGLLRLFVEIEQF